ncbi:MAG TPA: SRPBCC domain-containing protein [Candidatus Limnocylindrales bacterium]|nr:SRPBCC domain-containing protein [Candidatus Limnocylindrales bacterium]
MSVPAGLEPIHIRFDVDCDARQAFDLWTTRTSLWWPVSHTVSTEGGFEVIFEPRPGGRIFERTPDGTEHEWGEVLEWEPPRRLVYLWHLRADRADATEVEIRFTTRPMGTQVEIEHRGWDRLGAASIPRREANLAGWGGLLPHYRVLANKGR